MWWNRSPTSDSDAKNTTAEDPSLAESDDGTGLVSKPDLSASPNFSQEEDPSSDPEPSIQRLSDGFLRLEDQEGNPVQGLSILVEENEVFQGWMAIPGRIGSAIYHDSILQEGVAASAVDGLPITEDGNQADLHFVIADGYEPIVEEWNPVTAGDTHRTILTQVDPISVTVQDEDENPIPEAEVWLRWIGETTFNEEGTTLERLQGRHYQEKVITDEKGKAIMTVCFPGASNSLFVRPGDAFASQQVVCASGEDVVITCKSAFTIKGKITIDGKLPDREVQVMAMLPVGDSFFYLESGRAKEEGRYTVQGVLSGYPMVMVQAMGEGLAMQLRHFPGGEPGEVIEMDFDMKPGVGGEILILDAWGEPLPGATVQLVGEGDQRHVYRYETNEEGRCSLPVTLFPGDSFWMDVGFSGTTMRVPEAFVAGEETTLQIPNMARISSVTIPSDLLGETAVTELAWDSQEPSVEGLAVWKSSDALSPNLIAGRGSLTALLSDGRSLAMPAYLEPGSQDAIVFAAETAFLRFQLPENRVASVYLIDQGGNPAYEQEALEGACQLPCWVGGFSLAVYWEGGYLFRSGIQVPSGGLDLGLLGETTMGEVSGFVRLESGAPVGWADLYVTSQDGYHFQENVSDVDGSYYFGWLPLGSYYLYASSDQYHGGAGESRIQEFSISAGQPVIDLDIVMGMVDGELVVEHESNAAGGMEILHVTQSGIQFRDASPAGKTVLPAQTDHGLVGAILAKSEQVQVSSTPVQSGPGSVVLPPFEAQLHEVLVVDEHGTPRFDVILRLELAGFPPTGRLVPGADGILRLSIAGAGPWDLHARDEQGGSHRVSLVQALATGRFEIPRKIPVRTLQVVDQEGKALPFAEAMDQDLRQVFRADREGRIDVPLQQEWVLVDALGFLPLWVKPEDSVVLEMPRVATGLQVVVPEGGSLVSWSHSYSDSTAFHSEAQVFDADRTVGLPLVPFGELNFILWNGEEEQKVMKSVNIDRDDMTITLEAK